MNDKIQYDDEGVHRECDSLNLKVDEQALEYTKAIFQKYDAPQRLFDEATRYHARLVNFYFTPKNYSWKQRIQFAFYFLTGIGR